MEHLCASFWFWFAVLVSMIVGFFASLAFGYFTGMEVGRRSENLKWEIRVKELHRKWELEVEKN